MEIWRKIGNVEKNWKHGGEMCKFGEIIEIWQFGKKLQKGLESLKKIGNLEKFWIFGRNLGGKTWKFEEKKFEKNVRI